MDLEKNRLICPFCNFEFSSISTKNRHIRTQHPEQDIKGAKRTRHIICPVCTNQDSFQYHADLIRHLKTHHSMTIKESDLHFRNIEEFSVWRTLENREVDYVCRTGRKHAHGDEEKIYDCNRSNYRGFVSSARKRKAKRGGSIRIHGTCPSRIMVKIFREGMVAVKFVETHVGHTDEIRTKRLSKAEQERLVQKLTEGVLIQRIIEDSRIIKNDQLERRNLVTRANLAYLIKKFKIENNVKSVKCKHIHAEAKQREDARVSDKHDSSSSDDEDGNELLIEEPSTVPEDDAHYFIEETRPPVEEEKREKILEEMNSFARGLDEESFSEYVDMYRRFKADIEQNTENKCKRRKIENQTLTNHEFDHDYI